MAADEQRGVVLLDVASGEGEFDRAMLERMGHPVTVCNGPDIDKLCPLLGGEGCEKFERAHGVVFELDLERAQHRDILERYRELGPEDLPIRVVLKPGQAERYPEVVEAFEIWTHTPSIADLDGFAAEVEAADRYAGA